MRPQTTVPTCLLVIALLVVPGSASATQTYQFRFEKDTTVDVTFSVPASLSLELTVNRGNTKLSVYAPDGRLVFEGIAAPDQPLRAHIGDMLLGTFRAVYDLPEGSNQQASTIVSCWPNCDAILANG
ncbi:MAG TPA: hypothetical protein VM681_01085 [Candidatus Thermoplasmatota archaeon]|nr:hypothetical protein [Candidatus Thermoplasmatota archaeon]